MLEHYSKQEWRLQRSDWRRRQKSTAKNSPSPYTSLLSQCFTIPLDQDNPTLIVQPLQLLTDDTPYDFTSQPPVPLQFSSHHLDLLFRFLFPHNRFHWVHPEHFMSFGIHFADINYKWVTFFITQQHWVSVIKLLPNFPAYHFLIPIGLTASLVVQRFSELTHIPTEEIRSRGDFFPSTPPGLCGPAAALALLRKFKLKHFSRTKYFLDRCTNHLYDYSHSGIFEILQYAASLDTLFSADEGEISSSAGGNLSSSHTQSAQELIQRTIIQRNLIRYMTPLAPAEYLSDADIQVFIPQLQHQYVDHHVHILPGPRHSLSPLSQPSNCIIFYTTPHIWQVYLKSDQQLTHCVAHHESDPLPATLFPFYTDLECIQFLLRPHSEGWNGFNLLSHILHGQQTLENTLDLYHQIESYRSLPSHLPLFQAGSLSPYFTPTFSFSALQLA